MLVGAAALLACNAHAGQTLDTTGFTLSQPGQWSNAQMAVLSDHGGILQIGISGLQPVRTVTTDLGNAPWYNWDAVNTGLSAYAKPGYRLASVTLSGTLTGLLGVAPLPAVCSSPDHACGLGVATNQATLEWGTSQGPTSVDYQQLEVNNLDGERTFSLTTTFGSGDAFDFYIATYNTAYAEAGRYRHLDASSTNYLPTTSEIGFGDMVMTVQIVAVPEPGTYAMLLAGMGLLGMAARRQRKDGVNENAR
ncbi:hypothetical protein GCM10011572_44950 [Pseudoduganella buxea]|uniref:Ice-binding protein C-terminal domain-containing protein n=2 Tax=Pseudoduganella buxea TaxID=1949069 RepID=A0ABQ1L6I3_9BURK|nr:hypothetical protein GCM10011572_44950 [Pseudoduganella buxea]